MIEPLFENMNLIKPLLSAIAQCGYNTPTPIQQETIPPVLDGRDVLGCAQTGTGKTAAFALPILQRLHESKPKGKGRPIRALILTPTRELALQIYENFLAYGKQLPLRSCVIFGGVGQQPQVDALRKGVDILVATPGRLNDLIGQGHISLSDLEIFVLDEADRMLDMGFIHDVKRVIAQLPAKRQTLFFSATMPQDVEKLALSILTDPVTVKVDPVSSTVDTIRQYLYMVDKGNKKHLLADLLSKPNVESALVFTRTKHGADRVVRELSRAGITARAIHGDKSQNARQEALGQFKKGKIHVLIATDIAARGIDIAGLSHVFNYDLPNEPEAYVHRIGRTGRAGHEGIAISFCCIDEQKQLNDIEKLIQKKLIRLESQWPMQIFTETVKQPPMSRQQRLELLQSKRKEAAKTEKGGKNEKAAQADEKKQESSAPQKEKASAKKDRQKPEAGKKLAREQAKKQAKEQAKEQRSKHGAKAVEASPLQKEPKEKKRSNGKADFAASEAPIRAKEADGDKKRREKIAQTPPQTAPRAENAAEAKLRPVVIRQEKTPAANNRFGPGSAALRATPLERPSARLSQRETSDKISVTAPEPLQEETRVSYQQYMANQRRMRSRLSTGDDRR